MLMNTGAMGDMLKNNISISNLLNFNVLMKYFFLLYFHAMDFLKNFAQKRNKKYFNEYLI